MPAENFLKINVEIAYFLAFCELKWSFYSGVKAELDNRKRKMDQYNKKLSYCWETVRRESMPRIAEMDVKMTT